MAEANSKRGRKPRVWLSDAVALLGTMSDAKVAKRLGCCELTVGKERRRRQIPTYQTQRKFSPDDDRVLADPMLTQKEMAAMLGRSVPSVRGRLQRLRRHKH